MPGRRAGSSVGKYNAESSKQGSIRFNFITKTINFAHMVILFIYEKDFVPDLSSCKKNKIVYTIYNLHLLVPVGF